MKTLTSILLLLSCITAIAQTDTIKVDGKTYTGTIGRNYSDRFIFKTANGAYLVSKQNLQAMSITNRVVIDGKVGTEQVTDISKLSMRGLPDYHDNRYFLKQAGIQGIVGTTLFLTGAAMVAYAVHNNSAGNQQDILKVGTIIGVTGVGLYLPMSILLVKSANTRNLHTL